MANKPRRRGKRLYEKHLEYFETLARQIIENGEATVDFGVVTVEVRVRRSGRWLEIEAPDYRTGSDIGDLEGERLVSSVALQLIHVVAQFRGVQIDSPRGTSSI